ncbi:hypothetical protein AVEN_174150-1 [Araneus ventricosus]|uniref:Uncharacterized protein n=1 Tax=Araneus ventricosus TaxID=182803 RepID=A0A4Y2EN93_ARAVE|nr:hypothetical protein AVEN_174150-1 [Araneus ventricosus]
MVRFSIHRYAQFRQSFVSTFAHVGNQVWYPGHMYKGVLQMQAKLAVVDCILEVHDARISFDLTMNVSLFILTYLYALLSYNVSSKSFYLMELQHPHDSILFTA